MADENRCLLSLDTLVTGYGKKQVLNGVSLKIVSGEIVALIGHNGAGKSTLLKAAFGTLPIWSGSVALDGMRLHSPAPLKCLSAGVAYVPQGNRVFNDLTVRENLEVGTAALANKLTLQERIDRALVLFPTLRGRLQQRARALSGGEKQMVALANALIILPRLILLDEPSLGLSRPLVVEAMGRLQEINRASRVSLLVVEQKVREVLNIAHRVYVLRNGRVSFSGQADLLKDDAKLREVYL